MDEKLYTITLEDGTIIGDLRLNGTNFVSKTEITSDMFDGKLSTVTFSDGEVEDVHHNMELVQITKEGDEWWFVLIDIPENELKMDKLRADVDFLSMMANLVI